MKHDSLKQYVRLRQGLLAEKAELETRLSAINQALDGTGKVKAFKSGKRRKMSKSARAKIAAAQRARWKKFHDSKKK